MTIFSYTQDNIHYFKQISNKHIFTQKNKKTNMATKRIIISGATSGIGCEIAKLYIADGCKVGIMGRRIELLNNLKSLSPENVYVQQLDINSDEATTKFQTLIDQMGGIDIYFHVSGIGYQNVALDYSKELNTVETNCKGFTRMITYAFNYFSDNGGGHIAAITSIAGTKGLGVSPAYSATKRFQNHYIQCLAQLSNIRKKKIYFTDIRPGFVATDLLNDEHHYPMLMNKEYVAKIAYKAAIRKKRIKIIDWRYVVLVAGWRLIPNYIWERLRIKN